MDCVFNFVRGPATALLTGTDGCVDFAGGGGCRYECASAVFADEVAASVTSLAVAGAASPADLARVVAVDVSTLADAGMVTVGVADLANAGMVFPADLAGVVAADVTTLAKARMVTVGVADLADAGMAFKPTLLGWLLLM